MQRAFDGEGEKRMKKRWIVLLVLLICVVWIAGARQPLCRFDSSETVTFRFEHMETGLQTQNGSLPAERNAELQEILGGKAWFFGAGSSDFFLGQNNMDLQKDDMVTLYFGGDSLSVSSNGVIRSIHRDKYAYLRLIGTQKEGRGIYGAVYALIEPYLEV